MKKWNWKFFLCSFLIIFIISMGVAAWIWTELSYNSYYNGVASHEKQEAFILEKAVEFILTSSIAENAKKEAIEALFSKTFSEIRITNLSTGENLIAKESKRKGYIREIEIMTKIKAGATHEYEFYYAYDNRPPVGIGLLRAATVSLCDYYINKMSFSEWWDLFVNAKLWMRSQHFYMIFFPMFFLLSFVLIATYAYRLRREAKDKERELKIHEAESERKLMTAKLESINQFRYMYNLMFREFQKKAVIDSKQDLQVMEFSWQPLMKTLVKDIVHNAKNEFAERRKPKSELLMQNIALWENGTSMAQHDDNHASAINEIAFEIANKMVNDVYDKIIQPFSEKVLSHLRELPRIIDITPAEYSALVIYNSIKEGIPQSIYRDQDLKLHIGLLSIKLEEAKCNVNLYRINSIVYNLLANSNVATQRLADTMMEEQRPYQREIYLEFDQCEQDEIKYFRITISDNGGGFSNEVLQSIYQNPIESSDHSKGTRKGEGTMYIGFFVQYMTGRIRASNWKTKTGIIGAKTEMMIPITH